MKLIKLYKDLLSTAGLIADKDGFISAVVDDSTLPFMVKEKRMVLPSKEQLTNSDWSNRTVFHPMRENIMHGESDVMERFRKAINIKLNYTFNMLMTDLISLGISVDIQKKLSPDQSEILTCLKNVDEKTLSTFRLITKAMGIDGTGVKSIVHIFLKRKGIVNNTVYTRSATVTFPLYEELLKKEKTVFGVPVRKIDVDAYTKLLEYVVPLISTPKAYDQGSNSDIAPFLDCLMRSVIGLANCINSTIDVFKDYLEISKELTYNDTWVDDFNDLNSYVKYVRAIPMQAGNEGNSRDVVPAPTQPTFAVAPPTPQAPVQQYQPQMQQPMYPAMGYQPAPAPTGVVISKDSGGIDFAQMSSRLPMPMGYNPQMNNPQYNQQPTNMAHALRQPQQYNQQYPQQYNPQPVNMGRMGIM